MKKDLMILLVAICFVALMAVVVIAENDSDTTNTNFVISGNNASNASNMTFGKCVAEVAKLRQGCYAEDKNISKQCVSTAKAGKDKKAAKTCVSSYKESKKGCKVSFQEAKITCIQTYKPGFWERMRYTFK